jgi:hypothetical protein
MSLRGCRGGEVPAVPVVRAAVVRQTVGARGRDEAAFDKASWPEKLLQALQAYKTLKVIFDDGLSAGDTVQLPPKFAEHVTPLDVPSTHRALFYCRADEKTLDLWQEAVRRLERTYPLLIRDRLAPFQEQWGPLLFGARREPAVPEPQPETAEARPENPMLRVARRAADNFPRIRAEMESDAGKRSHWAWYLMPTTRAGNSQPKGAVQVMVPKGQERQYIAALQELGQYEEWVRLLQLTANKRFRGFNALDKGRARFFYEQWHRHLADAVRADVFFQYMLIGSQ